MSTLPDTRESESPGPRDLRSEPQLAAYLDALWRARWVILAGTVLAGLSSWGVSASTPRQYEAAAMMMVAPPKVGQGAIGSGPGLEVRNYRSYLENQSLSADLIREFKLDAPPHKLTPARFLDDVLTVGDVRDSRLLEVRVKLGEPKLAADVANELSRRAVELSRTVNQEEVVVARDLIKEQLDAARLRLTAARSAYEEGQRVAQVELLERDVETLLEQQRDLRVVQVSIERERARLTRAEQELARQDRVRDVRRSLGTLTAPDVRSSPAPASRVAPSRDSRPTTRDERSPASRDDRTATSLQDAVAARPEERSPKRRESPVPAKPDDRSTEAPLPILEDLLDPYVNPVYEYLNQQVASGRASLAALEREGDVLKQTLRGKGGQFPVLAELYRRKSEVDELEMQQELAEMIYVDVATRYEAARLQVAERSAQLQLLDKALPPEGAVSPRVAQNVAAAIVLAPSVLVTLIVLLEALRRVIAQPSR